MLALTHRISQPVRLLSLQGSLPLSYIDLPIPCVSEALAPTSQTLVIASCHLSYLRIFSPADTLIPELLVTSNLLPGYGTFLFPWTFFPLAAATSLSSYLTAPTRLPFPQAARSLRVFLAWTWFGFVDRIPGHTAKGSFPACWNALPFPFCLSGLWVSITASPAPALRWSSGLDYHSLRVGIRWDLYLMQIVFTCFINTILRSKRPMTSHFMNRRKGWETRPSSFPLCCISDRCELEIEREPSLGRFPLHLSQNILFIFFKHHSLSL